MDAKTIILLGLVKVLERKGLCVLCGKFQIGFDNRTSCWKIAIKITKASMLALDARAEIAQI